jgi:hypothetical protein
MTYSPWHRGIGARIKRVGIRQQQQQLSSDRAIDEVRHKSAMAMNYRSVKLQV